MWVLNADCNWLERLHFCIIVSTQCAIFQKNFLLFFSQFYLHKAAACSRVIIIECLNLRWLIIFLKVSCCIFIFIYDHIYFLGVKNVYYSCPDDLIYIRKFRICVCNWLNWICFTLKMRKKKFAYQIDCCQRHTLTQINHICQLVSQSVSQSKSVSFCFTASLCHSNSSHIF